MSLRNETLTQVFSGEICEIYKNTFFKGYFRATASEKRTAILTFPPPYFKYVQKRTYFGNISIIVWSTQHGVERGTLFMSKY